MNDAFNDRTPTRPMMGHVTAETNGNGHNDPRTEPATADSYDSQAESARVDGMSLDECVRATAKAATRSAYEAIRAAEYAGNIMGDVARLRGSVEAMRTDVDVMRTDVDLMSHEQKRLSLGHSADVEERAKIRSDLSAIAKAVGVKRTFSGELHLSLPPLVPQSTAPNVVAMKATDTGHNFVIDPDEADRLEGMFLEQRKALESLQSKLAEERAEKKGAEAALEKLRADEKVAEDRRDARRKTLTLALTLVGLIITVASYAIGHIH